MKRAMPFALMIKEKVMKIGASAFNKQLDFNEKHTLDNNMVYLENTLDVSKLYVTVFSFVHLIYT